MLGITERAVQLNVKEGKYKIRHIDGVRGGVSGQVLQITLASLPAAARALYYSQQTQQTKTGTTMVPVNTGVYTVKERETALYKIKAVEAWNTYISEERENGSELTKVKMTLEFVAGWNLKNPRLPPNLRR